MLARDGGLIPIDSPDWRKIDSSKLARVWSLVQNSEQRKHCDDARVIQTQWQALVAHWDKMENKFFKRLAFENLEVEVREHGQDVTTEVRKRIYAEVLGPEKQNQLRGFGLRVGWADVPGIAIEQRCISREVKYLREAYEAQKQAIAATEEKMTRMMHEANEKAEKMKMSKKKAYKGLGPNNRRI
ncbi:unnamed protein product [Malus baccata var. baccata]